MLIGAILMFMLLAIGILYGYFEEKKSFSKEKGPGKIFKAAGWYYYRVLSKILDRQNYLKEKERIIYESLLLKNHVEEEIRESKASSVGKALSVLMLGILLIIGALALGQEEKQISDLERPDYGERAKAYQIRITEEDGAESVISLELESRKLKEEEVWKLFDSYYLATIEKMKGENPNLQNVTESLDFSPIEELSVLEADIYSSDLQLVDSNGNVNSYMALEDGSELTIYLNLSYEEFQKQYEIPVTVLKKERTGLEKFKDELLHLQAGAREDEHFPLPGTYEGKRLKYVLHEDDGSYAGILVLFIAVLALILILPEQRRREEYERRNHQMEADYPEMLSRFLILLRSGLPIKNIFQSMCSDYCRQEKSKGQIHYAYEELLLMTQGMENGSSESDAYMEFGRRCGLINYMKFANILVQNLKKGSQSMIPILEEERILAMEEASRQIKRKGEIAGTRLMFPMILLFALVMAIILVPSLMSFSL